MAIRKGQFDFLKSYKETKDDTERALFGKRDILLFTGLVAIALLVYSLYTLPARTADNVVARISVEREVVKTVELSESGEFELPDNPDVRFVVRNYAIAFIDSDCPDKICIRSGYLRYSGQIAVCVPNRIALVIIGRQREGVDAIAH